MKNDVCSVALYEEFVNALTFRAITTAFSHICVALDLDPLSDHVSFYTKLRSVLTNWKSEKLWSLFDKKLQQKEYKKQRACQGLRVLIIGAGPCGLRMAIECALLGAKVVVVEKRDRFSRNNVLHIWPFVIQDLRSLGAKLFYPKFCAGSIDHIKAKRYLLIRKLEKPYNLGIRQLQCILLKAALVLGVEVHENISFEELLEPSLSRSDTRGWHARFSPESHHVADYEFDVLIGADGKRNTVPGFRRKEMRGKLAIGITANFINKHSQKEQQVPEISGVACIFNPVFFKELRDETGIDLENIVYYKDETHYFVMCAKKQSLVDKGVIVQDFDDVQQLLSTANVSEKALFNYARQAADFSTNGALPHLDFAPNHNGWPDVAMFDFTSLFSAENSCRIVERNGHRLVLGIIGDSLHEPFWPTGSGCARGFLGAFDTAWLLRNYASGRHAPLELLAERESFYRLLAQSTPENLQKQIQKYTIDPRTRYPNTSVDSRPRTLPQQVAHLFDSDVPQASGSYLCYGSSVPEGFVRNVDPRLACGGADSAKRLRRSVEPSASTLPQLPTDFWQGYVRRGRLLRWCQWLVQPYKLRVENLTSSFRNGFVLGAILNRFRPDLIDYSTDLDPKDAAANNRKISAILREQLKIAFVPNDFATAGKAQITEFLGALQEYFAAQGDADASNGSLLRHSASHSASNSLSRAASASSPPCAYVQPQQQQASTGAPQKRKLSREMASAWACGSERIRPTERRKTKEDEEREERHRKRVEEIAAMLSVRPDYSEGLQENKASQKRTTLVEKLCPDRVKFVEDLLLAESTPSRCRERREKMSKPQIKVRKFEHDEIAIMESKLQDSVMGKLYLTEKMEKERDHNLSSQDAAIIAEKTAFLKRKAEQGFREDPARFGDFDKTFREFDNRMRLPNKTGLFHVSALTEHHEKAIPHKPVECKPPIGRTPSKPCSLPPESQNPTCYFCQTRVYFAERMCADGHYMHKSCFRCEFCHTFLNQVNYGYDRESASLLNTARGRFYCKTHLNLPIHEKLSKLPKAYIRPLGLATLTPTNNSNNNILSPERKASQASAISDATTFPDAVGLQRGKKSPVPPPVPVKKTSISPSTVRPTVLSPQAETEGARKRAPVATISPSPSLQSGLSATQLFGSPIQSTPERAEFECSFANRKKAVGASGHDGALENGGAAQKSSISASEDASLSSPENGGENEEDLDEMDEIEILSQLGANRSEDDVDSGSDLDEESDRTEGAEDSSASGGSSEDDDEMICDPELEEMVTKAPYSVDTLTRIAGSINMKRQQSKENILSGKANGQETLSGSSSSSDSENETDSTDESGGDDEQPVSEPSTMGCLPNVESSRGQNGKPPHLPLSPPPNLASNGSCHVAPTANVVSRRATEPTSNKTRAEALDEDDWTIFKTPVGRAPRPARSLQGLSGSGATGSIGGGVIKTSQSDSFAASQATILRPMNLKLEGLGRAAKIDDLSDGLASPLRDQKMAEFQRLKDEARARARLKSDEELMLTRHKNPARILSTSLSALSSVGLSNGATGAERWSAKDFEPKCGRSDNLDDGLGRKTKALQRQSAPDRMQHTASLSPSRNSLEAVGSKFEFPPKPPGRTGASNDENAAPELSRMSGHASLAYSSSPDNSPFESPKSPSKSPPVNASLNSAENSAAGYVTASSPSSFFARVFNRTTFSPSSPATIPSTSPAQKSAATIVPASFAPPVASTPRRDSCELYRLQQATNDVTRKSRDSVAMVVASGSTVVQSPVSPTPTIVSSEGSADLLFTGAATALALVSESVKETSLKNKMSKKFRDRKSRSKSPSATAPFEIKKTPEAKSEKSKSNGKSMSRYRFARSEVCPKATVDELSIGSSDEEEETTDDQLGESSRQTSLPPISSSARSSISKQSSSSNISERDVRRAERLAAKIVKQNEVKRMRQAQEIQRSLQEIEVRQKEISVAGCDLERQLNSDSSNRALLLQWANLVNERQTLTRKEQDLNIKIQEIELDQQHARLQLQLKERMLVAAQHKTRDDCAEESRILERMLAILAERNDVLSQLELRQKEIVQPAVDVSQVDEAGSYPRFAPVFSVLTKVTS